MNPEGRPHALARGAPRKSPHPEEGGGLVCSVLSKEPGLGWHPAALLPTKERVCGQVS